MPGSHGHAQHVIVQNPTSPYFEQEVEFHGLSQASGTVQAKIVLPGTMDEILIPLTDLNP